MNIFEADLQDAKKSLKNEKRKGFFKKLLTLGILNNNSEIIEAQKYLNNCSQDLEAVIQLKKQAHNISKLEETITFNGIRISKHTFSDIRVLEKEDYPQDWKQLRMVILERDNFKCQEENGYCSGPLQIHHIIELSRGGSNNPSNLITLCKHHHSMKHPHMQRTS
jgi:HNH endonuclease